MRFLPLPRGKQLDRDALGATVGFIGVVLTVVGAGLHTLADYLVR